MSELKKIRDLMDKKFNELKVELQNSCEHTEMSEWMEVYWAIGHGTGELVKECLRCGKVMEKTGGTVSTSIVGGKIESEVIFYDDEEKDDV